MNKPYFAISHPSKWFVPSQEKAPFTTKALRRLSLCLAQCVEIASYRTLATRRDVRRKWVLFFSFLIVTPSLAKANCDRPELTRQRPDAATIQKLETAWSLAYLSGDTEFESCLLTVDFTEIMSNGNINHLSDELALARKNKGKPVMNPNLPPVTIHMYGDVAVAYSISIEKLVGGKPRKSYNADYYVWTNGAWHVYFAQQTSFPL